MKRRGYVVPTILILLATVLAIFAGLVGWASKEFKKSAGYFRNSQAYYVARSGAIAMAEYLYGLSSQASPVDITGTIDDPHFNDVHTFSASYTPPLDPEIFGIIECTGKFLGSDEELDVVQVQWIPKGTEVVRLLPLQFAMFAGSIFSITGNAEVIEGSLGTNAIYFSNNPNPGDDSIYVGNENATYITDGYFFVGPDGDTSLFSSVATNGTYNLPLKIHFPPPVLPVFSNGGTETLQITTENQAVLPDLSFATVSSFMEDDQTWTLKQNAFESILVQKDATLTFTATEFENVQIFTNTFDIDKDAVVSVEGSGTVDVFVGDSFGDAKFDGVFLNDPHQISIYYYGVDDFSLDSDFFSGDFYIQNSGMTMNGGEITGAFYSASSEGISVNGNANLTAKLYAPLAEVTLSGNCNTLISVCRSGDLTGTTRLAYPGASDDEVQEIQVSYISDGELGLWLQ